MLGYVGRWLPVTAVAGAMLAAGAPDGVTLRGWQTLSVFAATIVGFLFRPLAMGPLVLVGLMTLLALGAFGSGKPAVKAMLDGFADDTVWLVVAAFLLSGTVVRTGFGRRIALLLIRKLGQTTLGLGYAIAGTELLLGPIIPSSTARGGGVMAPIVNALARALGSTPESALRRTGGYLVLCGSHSSLVASTMFFTGMAMNPQLGKYAADELGIMNWNWTTWLVGSCVPALVSFALLPWFVFRLHRPELIRSPEAPATAADELREMGRWSARQLGLASVLAAMVAAWATESLHAVPAAGVALLGITAIVVMKLDRWEEMLGDRTAWDSLIWLGGLVAMAHKLKEEQVVDWFARQMQGELVGYSGVAAAIVIALVYFFSMYGFSMLTGHIAALASVFFVVAKAAGAPPMLIVALISYFSNLCGCLTNYSTGQVVIYFGYGYVSPQKWFGVGLAMAAFHLAIWLGIGLPYWKLLGWW